MDPQLLLFVFLIGIDSPLLHGDPRENAEPKLTRRLDAIMDEAGVAVGIGQYDEARYLYTSPAFAVSDKPTDENTQLHLGIDLFAQAGTPVRAPLDGKVVVFADNASAQDYGPVVVIEHVVQTADDRPQTAVRRQRSAVKEPIKFYTLYGHLSREF